MQGKKCIILKTGNQRERIKHFILPFSYKLYVRSVSSALAGVPQWIEGWPVNRRVVSLIPSQGTCLGCGPGPQQLIHVSLTHGCFSPSLSPPLPLSLKINFKNHLKNYVHWIRFNNGDGGNICLNNKSYGAGRRQSQVRGYAWVAGQVPSRGRMRGNHTLMLLSLSFSLPSPLSKKIN